MSQSQPADPLPALVQDADRQLDIRIARDVFGHWDLVMLDGQLVHGESNTNGWPMPTPKYSSDWSAIRLVEDEIERRGIGERYAMHLDVQLDLHATELDSHDFAWRLLRASCEDRCKAALSVCGALHDRRTDA